MKNTENNKRIAEFMGATPNGGSTIALDGTFTDLYEVCINPSSRFKEHVKYYDKPTKSGVYSASDLMYDTSWDWLIPVVEKIESMGYVVEIKQTCTTIYEKGHNPEDYLIHVWDCPTKLEATYTAVTEFLNNLK